MSKGIPKKSELTSGIEHASVVAFPSGKVLTEATIPYGEFYRSADPGYVVFHHFGPFHWGQNSSTRSAAAQWSTGFVIISNTPALDVFGHSYVAEPNAGEVGLYEIGKGLQTSVALPK